MVKSVLCIHSLKVTGNDNYLGETLEERLKTKPSLDLALKWSWQIASAVQYLHQHQLIHRDLRPSKIFIDKNENAIVGGLGYAYAHNYKSLEPKESEYTA